MSQLKKFVFCEGPDDRTVIKAIADSIGLSDLIIEELGGKDNLGAVLKALHARPAFARKEVSTLAIIRDADHDGAAAFQSVCDGLKHNGFDAPASNGNVIRGEINTGVYVIGPNNGQGMLEDLCLKSLNNQPDLKCVDQYFQCIEQNCGRNDFSSKAKFYVWRYSHPHRKLGVKEVTEAGFWLWSHPAFNELKNFLRLL